MLIQRQSQRLAVEIPITITTVLDSLTGIIVDLSLHGAQVTGCGLPKGTRFQFEYVDQTVFAQCMWSEIDRMGVKFAFPLAEGALYDRLQSALSGPSAQTVAHRFGPAGNHPGESGSGIRQFGRAPSGGSGRRPGF